MSNITTAESSESNFMMILKSAMNFPGVKIRRGEFLRTELSTYFDSNVVEMAIKTTPAKAGITTKQIEKIANSCIKYETNKVTAVSAVSGIPGGLAMFGTVPADIAQYFAHVVRILQKLIYLYGWKELYNDEGEFDDETSNMIILFMGVMFGVNTATATITKLSYYIAPRIEKVILSKALTKGVIYPIVKKIAALLGVKMTKEIFARGVSKVVPVLGAFVSGALTYNTFKPSAKRLQQHLVGLPMADVNYYRQEHKEYPDLDLSDIVDMV